MATKISYCDETWNPVTGCTKHSPGCANCYAAQMAPRLKNRFGYGEDPFQITFHEYRLEIPYSWKSRKVVFICSMGDLFHKDVLDKWIDMVMEVVRTAVQHQFLIFTKRAQRMHDYMMAYVEREGAMPRNAWLGVSVEDQKRADERLPLLLETPAAHRFLSVEPLLEHVNLSLATGISTIDWVITGGESGRQARFMEADWARAIRDQCQENGVPFYMKQMSRKEAIPIDLDIQQLPIGMK